jgi:hypothetical protein
MQLALADLLLTPLYKMEDVEEGPVGLVDVQVQV